MADIQSIKNRFGIIGNSESVNHAINVAIQVAATDLSVLISGESGVGKEVFSQIIHSLSGRKHNPFIAVNCGAIPEGTIDSELFGHEKGAFTGAVDSRKGYFETVNGGTIFLDEIGEMPLGTQARLLRMLETGEFIRVGSSKVQKSDVRVIAATNKDLLEQTHVGRFREDLYYRLSSVPIRVPSLRDRKEDIPLLFRKFVVDFAERYKTTPVQLEEDARQLLVTYPWPGNVRELKNIAEQISVLSNTKFIDAAYLRSFLPEKNFNRLPVLAGGSVASGDFANEREILYKLFFDMKKDVSELKRMFLEVLKHPTLSTGNGVGLNMNEMVAQLQDIPAFQPSALQQMPPSNPYIMPANTEVVHTATPIHEHVEVEESLSIADTERDLIMKALKKHKMRRRKAAADLGISERTLYRKLKELNIVG